MARARLEVVAHLSASELAARAKVRRGVDAKESRRWRALSLIGQGQGVAEAARVSGLSKSWVAEIAGRYNRQGPAGVEDGHRQRRGGPAPILDAAGQAALAAALEAAVPQSLGGGLWSGRKVAAWVKQHTGGKTFHPQQGWVWMKRLGFSLRVPRPRHPQAASPAEAAAWKKSCVAR